MIKNVFIILFIIILFGSCEKSDPVYNEENQNSKIFNNYWKIL
jgi:hypothetical protein